MDRHIDAADRQHTDRATRAVHHAHILRQQVRQTVARDGMRMAAAKFHETVATIALDTVRNLAGDALGNFAVAEFVYVFHAASLL